MNYKTWDEISPSALSSEVQVLGEDTILPIHVLLDRSKAGLLDSGNQL